MLKGRIHTVRRVALLGIVALGFGLPEIVAAQERDLPGSQDHPLISRYQGSYINSYEVRDYDRFVLALGKGTRDAAGNRVAERKRDLEGKVTRLLYNTPEGRSPFEVLSNYEMALQQAGFEILFTCAEAECGNQYEAVIYPAERRHAKKVIPATGFELPRELNYLAAKMLSASGNVYVSLLVGFDPIYKNTAALLEVIETKEMDTGMVTVNAEAIAQGIDATGHMTLYGIYFDTGSATIKPESASTLEEIAKLLAQEPSLKLLVVGHTDNQGSYEYNMGLSQHRAEAVVQALVSKHGVAASRLRAAGAGYIAPVASNDTEDGRAKNRRVELVKQ